MANTLAQYLADLQVQIKESESRLVFGVVISTSPLRVKYGEITLEDNFLFVEDGVTLTVGQKVPMLKTNRSQLFIVMLSKEMTPEEILSKIKTVDGSGSGIDADLLDGKHASYFSLDGHTQDWTTITGKPTTFPSSAHTHTLTDVTDLSSIMDVRSNGLGLAIGKVSEKNAFEVAMPTEFSNNVTVGGSSVVIQDGTSQSIGLVPKIKGSSPTGHSYLQFMNDASTRLGFVGFGSDGTPLQLSDETGRGVNVLSTGPVTVNGKRVLTKPQLVFSSVGTLIPQTTYESAVACNCNANLEATHIIVQLGGYGADVRSDQKHFIIPTPSLGFLTATAQGGTAMVGYHTSGNSIKFFRPNASPDIYVRKIWLTENWFD